MIVAVEELLRKMPLFAELSPEALRGLADRLERHTVGRGDDVFVEGDRGDSVCLVLSGKIKIIRSASDGRENLLAVLGPGDLFGELSVFDPGPRTATAAALVDTEYASLSHHQLRPWLGTRPEAAEILLAALARRLRKTNDAMADLIFTDVPGRVAKALLSLSEQFGVETPAGLVVEHGLTQEELAQLVGASRETVNKALADFANRGWLQVEQRQVTLIDVERLAHRSR